MKLKIKKGGGGGGGLGLGLGGVGSVPVGVRVSEKKGHERRGEWVLTWVSHQSR